jgi:hypothetical protein
MLSQLDGIDDLLWGASGSKTSARATALTTSSAAGCVHYSQYDMRVASQGARSQETDEAMLAKAVAGLDDTVISFELNDVNKQPCMAALVRVLNRMNMLFNQAGGSSGGAGTGATWRDDMLPGWVNTIRDRLADYSETTGGRNIRLFMLRLLLNQPVAAIVARWSAQLLPAGKLLRRLLCVACYCSLSMR